MTDLGGGRLNRIELEDPRDFLVWRAGSGNTVEIYDIAVGSDRRRGKGTALLSKLLAIIGPDPRCVFAITRATNFVAQQFYERRRFRVVGVLRHFYQDGPEQTADAIMYGRDIGSLA